jgi:hypothetical protein
MYTYRLINSQGLTVRIDIYLDGKFTNMSKRGPWLPKEARKIAQEDCDVLNGKI